MKSFRSLSLDMLKLMFVGLVGFIIVALFFWFLGYYFFDEEDYIEVSQEEQIEEPVCNVTGLELRGELTTYISSEEYDSEGYPLVDQVASEEMIWSINEANKNDEIKAIIIEVDSYGGVPTAAEEINSAVEHSEKPVIAYIRSAGLSAAYWAISGADHIIALPSSDIGSIGVTLSFLDYSNQNIEEGLTFNQLSTGKYKDMLSYDKPVSDEERELIMRDLDLMNENFIKTISGNREIEIEKVEAMADGSSMLAQMALENKLIDQIGTGYDVKDYMEELIGEEVEICW